MKQPCTAAWLLALAGACPAGAVVHNGHEYLLTSTAMTWDAAEAEAVAQGGHLVTINHATEEAFIQAVFGTNPLWLGLNDCAAEGTWVWTSGEPVNYTNWNDGEPNNMGWEDAAIMNWGGAGFGWNDVCQNDSVFQHPGVIERPADVWRTTGALAGARLEHTATLLGDGRVLVAGGNRSGTMLGEAELHDPATGTWTATGALANPRWLHAAVLLPNGRVLVVGGDNQSGRLASAEVYDPATGTWTATASLAVARSQCTATLLRSGKVLVAGGLVNTGATPAAELYDPASCTWQTTGDLGGGRYRHTATLLGDGRVLVTGGSGGSGAIATAEIYDPDAGTWSPAAPLGVARYDHTATVLADGKVLVAGGSPGSGALASAELYDPDTGLWAAANPPAVARDMHTATRLPTGQVLFVGGEAGGTALAGAELYDPTTGIWITLEALADARFGHTATILPDGRVLVAAGGTWGSYHASAEIYDGAVGSWTAAAAMPGERQSHTATMLGDGRVLVVSGWGDDHVLTTAAIYDPVGDTWSNTGSLAKARVVHSATLLPNGKVLVVGGDNWGTKLGRELYDPASGSWTAAGPAVEWRERHTATLLPSGKVLVAGGYDRYGGAYTLRTAELYDPVANSWSATGSLGEARHSHTATLLPDGRVLVSGGARDLSNMGTESLDSAELYDPATGTWSFAAPLNQARQNHTATLLPNGRLLIAAGARRPLGGSFVPLASAEIYDPAAGTWCVTGSLTTARVSAVAVLLAGGRVLIAGGVDAANAPMASVELYDPATAAWTTGPAMASRRGSFTTTLLADGRVLAAGGSNGSDTLATAELYDPGLGFAETARPQVATATFDAAARLVLTGTGFRGVAGGSCGTTRDSATDFPLVQLRSLVNEQTAWLACDPAAGWSNTTFTSAPVAGFWAGHALVTVVANGIPSAGTVVLLAPELVVEQPAGTELASGASRDFGTMVLGSPPSLAFTIRNTGPAGLMGLGVTTGGPDAVDFKVAAAPAATVPGGGSTTFTLRFDPSASGAKTATASLWSGDADESPFEVGLTGRGLSHADDGDGDGLNDASEFEMAALGFDWQTGQPDLVGLYYGCANHAELYTCEQLQALHVGTPMIARDPVSGLFKLTIGVEKSTDLLEFEPFPMSAGSTRINPAGKLEFEFPGPDPAAFFLLEVE